MSHRSRLCHFVLDVTDLDRAIEFWSRALDATEEPVNPESRHVYRRLRLPDAEIRILLQATTDKKVSKERMHLDIETDDVPAEVARLEALGAVRWDHQQERGYDFWVLRDPFDNEFCVLQTEFPDQLARRPSWD
ncbi:VOC family protein [Nocardia sp. CDC153]|uniref:VOC family protein n=1 Tax=Nocardia sp. CDC153 TaxID=3112167 RepID=UPI002DB7D23E|nr:VOC family protein [Nocardia sp. CDC153]MEC3953276.1 VOC family protein [Nocardia sp. CDC153]